MPQTTYEDVLNVFHSMPMSKYVFLTELEYQWFLNALSDYELEISNLNFDESTKSFEKAMPRYVVKTLGLIMYTNYLTQELSRLMKLNGIIGKDISLTGMDSSKKVTYQELYSERELARQMLHKQKQHCFK